MVFFVVNKTLMLFFVTILLLICSSHAGLQQLGQYLFKLNHYPKDAPKTTLPTNPPKTTLPTNPPKTTLPPPPEKVTVRATRQTTEEEIGNAERFFGPDGAKNFRIGWKVGKKVYSVIGKCEEYRDYFKCPIPSSSDTCSTSDGSTMSPVSALYCVLEFTQLNATCHENCGVPPETPCSYSNGDFITCTSLKYASPVSPVAAPDYAVPTTDSPSPDIPPKDSVPYPNNYGNRIMVLDLYQCLAIMIIAICSLL